MNKKEVKFDHFKDIEELIKHLEMWYAEDDYFAFDRYFHLRDARIMGMFIYELQQENKQLKEENERYRKLGFKHLNEQNNQLKEVIEEVREYINHEWFKRGQLGIIDKSFQEWELNKLLQLLDKVKENK